MSEVIVKPNSTQLAMSRTWLAYERTLMAWIRTAASMISFGFTIYKFFQYEAGRTAKVNSGLLSPRDFALVMVSIGLISLFLATLQHHSETKELASQLGRKPRSLAELVAGIVSLFGILVFLAAVLRV